MKYILTYDIYTDGDWSFDKSLITDYKSKYTDETLHEYTETSDDSYTTRFRRVFKTKEALTDFLIKFRDSIYSRRNWIIETMHEFFDRTIEDINTQKPDEDGFLCSNDIDSITSGYISVNVSDKTTIQDTDAHICTSMTFASSEFDKLLTKLFPHDRIYTEYSLDGLTFCINDELAMEDLYDKLAEEYHVSKITSIHLQNESNDPVVWVTYKE